LGSRATDAGTFLRVGTTKSTVIHTVTGRGEAWALPFTLKMTPALRVGYYFYLQASLRKELGLFAGVLEQIGHIGQNACFRANFKGTFMPLEAHIIDERQPVCRMN
jgi:hypothetical protein